MKTSDSDRNVFIIKDMLDEYSQFLRIDCPYFKHHSIKFDQLISVVNDLDSSVISKDKTIILVSRDMLDKERLKEIKSIFYNKFGFDSIHIISLVRHGIKDLKKEIRLTKDLYFYLLPETETVDSEIYISNLILYINTVFQLLQDQERIDDYIINSFKMIVDTEIIKKQKNEIENLNRILDKLSKIDYLTNILNRRAFFEALEKERKRAVRSIWRVVNNGGLKKKGAKVFRDYSGRAFDENQPSGEYLDHIGKYSCILMDIDDFKMVNDKKGHLVGDQVIKRLAELVICGQSARGTDIAGRYGGEEFVVLLPETGSTNAKNVAVRLRNLINKEEFHDSEGNHFHITVSMGISEFRVEDKFNNDILLRADKALYYAKEHGKDQIVIYEEVYAAE